MAAAPREVSCLALTFFYDYLEANGIPRERLQSGLPYSPAYLNSRINWIDYATFLEIERRMAELLPDPDLFYRIGLTFSATKGFGFLRVIFRSVGSPMQVYEQLPRLVKRFLFPFVDIHFEERGPGRFRATYSFAEGYPPSDAFLGVVRGILAGAPGMIGSKSAQVTLTRLSPLVAAFDVTLPPGPGVGLRAFKGLTRRVRQTGQRWWRNLSEAVVELEETNRLLQDQVDALTDAKQQLDRRVRELTILNKVSRAATGGAFDLQRLLQSVVDVLSEKLGAAPAAVLLAEGEPRRLVLAAAAAFSRELEGAVRHENLWPVLDRQRLEVGEGPHRVVVLPMVSRERVLAALAVAGPNPEDESLLESVASQLAVVVDNALSYQTIADLRDNLEVRVRERTAELEEARAQLVDTVERLKRSDRARTEFFTNVSHELRTPLTLIVAPLDSLAIELRDAPPQVQEELRLVRSNAQALLRLINEILDFARLDAERLPLRPARVVLDDVVDDVIVSLRPLADRKDVRLEWVRPPEPVAAVVDPDLFRRVVANLVGNGIKYVEDGKRVSVSLRGEHQDAVLVVADDGPGIPREYHARVFERFQRVPDAHGRLIEGSGIGLAMVREIVSLHQGAVSLQSEPGAGAAFTVRLPRHALVARAGNGAEAEHPAPAVPLPDEIGGGLEPPLPTADAERPNRHRPRLLLVEDHPDMRSFLSRLLASDFRVVLAADGEEALELAHEQLLDGVLSDVMMPRVDGLELCRRLKADRLTRHLPVILVSARHGADAALEGFAAGADDYIVKPFSAPELLARVNAQLRVRRLALALMRAEKQTTLGLMAAGIAHEVRNPMNALLNAVPSLRRELDAVRAEAGESNQLSDALLDSIERSGERIRQVVDSMLALSRQAPGELRLREVRLSESIDATLAVLRFRTRGGVEIHKDYAWDGPVWCYPELVGQVVMNLVINALDAVDPNVGHIAIELRRDGDDIRVEVRDDGPGIAPEMRELVFEPFYTTKPPGVGTGLGLAVSREIAALHGGSLELEATDGKGAAFVLVLPGESTLQPPSTGPTIEVGGQSP
jgi:signal transduction histidine kinase